MHKTTFAWPCRLTRDADDRLLVRFIDIPEALTDGADETEALSEAADALSEAISGRLIDGEPIPGPSAMGRNDYLVPLDTLLAYKVALAEVMRAERITKVALAKKLRVDEKVIRRLLDPTYRGSRVARLSEALSVCGMQASATIIDTAKRSRLFRARTEVPTGQNRKITPNSAVRIKRRESAI